ncbi:uncharacterized protein BP01DRAFT_396606 [Aspergillus saccharolyticus JOP 1030-1]|uniref:Uncharacterized protein n=1 Tax=Aspergillus saccharolyticus JOP 1030-1 TaxID=1450539 RepID=A0A318ZS54_9EURO|nr:hypothetical protein BP01DRAFT_396606 [Aspergillus saccharolyticus JOP 1030-1]PYH49927.1 hypothetical protein BP01DRAFT_396606 [Aspergillus saccharolyticus JOP 1030-1]
MPSFASCKPIDRRVARCISDAVNWDEDLRPSNEPDEGQARRGSTEATSIPSPSPGEPCDFGKSHKPQSAKSIATAKPKGRKPSTRRRTRTAVKKPSFRRRGKPVSDDVGKGEKVESRRKRLIEVLQHACNQRIDGSDHPLASPANKISHDDMLSPASTDEHCNTLLPDKENIDSILSIFQMPELDDGEGLELRYFDLQGEISEFLLGSMHRSQSLENEESRQRHLPQGSLFVELHTGATMADSTTQHNEREQPEESMRVDSESHSIPEPSITFMEKDRSLGAQEIGTGTSPHEAGPLGQNHEGTPSSAGLPLTATSRYALSRERSTPESSFQESSGAEAPSLSQFSPKKTPKNTIVDTNGSPRLLSERLRESCEVQTLVLDDTAYSPGFYKDRTTVRVPTSFTNRLRLCAGQNNRPEITGLSQNETVQKMLLETSESLTRHIESENTTISEIFESFRKNCHQMLDQLSEAQEARVRLCQQQMEGIRKQHAKICEELVHRMRRDEERFQKILGIT